MARKLRYKTTWQETANGYDCVVKSIDDRTSRILASVRINVPVETESDFKRYYGDKLRGEVEKAATEIAGTIAEHTPE